MLFERINDTSKCYHERIYFDDKVVAIIQDYYKPTNIGLSECFYVITSTNECAAGFYTVADAKTELFQLLDAEHLATKYTNPGIICRGSCQKITIISRCIFSDQLTL